MKKSHLILFLMLLLALPASARRSSQDDFPAEVYVGLNGGAGLSTLTTMPVYVEKGYLMGYNGGITLRFITERHFGIESGLQYVQAGWKDNYGYKSPYSYERPQTWAELPFLMHAYLGSGHVRFFLNAGSQFGWLLDDQEYIDSEYTSEELPYYGLDVMHKFLWGIAGGAGLEFHFGRMALGLKGQYFYGLSNLFSDQVSDPMVTSSPQQITANLFWLVRIN